MGENKVAEFRERRAFFDAYFERVKDATAHGTPEYEVRYTCPCCGYPTLFERHIFDICELCNWEDDGQDDPYADAAWGGPNKSYSLTQARENFARYLVMYEPERDPRLDGHDSEAQRAAKQEVVRAFDAIIAAADPADPASPLWAGSMWAQAPSPGSESGLYKADERLWQVVDESLEALRRAPGRKFGEGRRRGARA